MGLWDYPRTVPGVSRHFLEMSWDIYVFPLFPKKKATHKQI